MPDWRVIGLSGGSKQLWLRQHRSEIMTYYSEHGPEATKQQFVMKEDTFQRFLVQRQIKYGKMTKADRALAVSLTSIEMSRDNRRELSQLKQHVEALEPAYQAMVAMGIALKMTERLPGVVDFLPSGENRA